MMITHGANGEETRDRGKYLFVLHKFNGEWKYERAIIHRRDRKERREEFFGVTPKTRSPRSLRSRR